MRASIFLTGLLLIVVTFSVSTQPRSHKKVLKLMGSRFEITAVDASDSLAWCGVNAAIAEITRIEKLISSWDPESQTSEINRKAGISPVKVDDELFQLIYRAKKVSQLTQGAFDISYASMDKIWKFDGSVTQLPTADEVAASVSKINYNDIILDKGNSSVFLKQQGMKIGFGAIGKGYAANRGRKVMEELGIKNGIVNAGGDLVSWGVDEDNQPWRIAIANPKDKGEAIGWLNTQNLAVVTSGNYEKFIMINGQRYSHIIDPRTGYPVNGLKSVTIVCPDAELADALATSVYVMGAEKGLELINKMSGVEALLVDDNDQLIVSKNLSLNYYE